MERTGDKLTDIIHKSNPWEAIDCNREDCMFSKSGNEKLIGKCKKRNIVYETECMICSKKEEEEGDEGNGAEPSRQYGLNNGMAKRDNCSGKEEKEKMENINPTVTNEGEEEERNERIGAEPSRQYRKINKKN